MIILRLGRREGEEGGIDVCSLHETTRSIMEEDTAQCREELKRHLLSQPASQKAKSASQPHWIGKYNSEKYYHNSRRGCGEMIVTERFTIIVT